MHSTDNNNDLHNFIVKANEYIEEEKIKIVNDILEKVKE
jgi:hypothetical protein